MAITAGTRVTNSAGRVGVVLYDNPAVTNDTHDSAYIAYNDNTYEQAPRGGLTTQSGGFLSGIGPGN